jgi:DNA modification methylase
MNEIIVNEGNALMFGDCLEHMKNIEANSVDMILTDPPYGINFVSSWTK